MTDFTNKHSDYKPDEWEHRTPVETKRKKIRNAHSRTADTRSFPEIYLDCTEENPTGDIRLVPRLGKSFWDLEEMHGTIHGISS